MYDKENEIKILELYQNFVEIQLENQRKEDLKSNGMQIVRNLGDERWPVWTLIPPWNHFTSDAFRIKIAETKDDNSKVSEPQKLSKI